MTNCSKSKCLGNVIAVFVFAFLYDMIVHGVILADAYKATASLWRPESEMHELWPYCIVFHIALAILFSALYKMSNSNYAGNYEASCSIESAPKAKSKTIVDEKNCCPMKRGLCFGVIIGLILGVMNATAYLHIPVPASLAISWFFAGLFQGIGIGLVLSFINNKKGCTINE